MAKSKKGDQQTGEKHLTISPPNLQTAQFRIVGSAPYVQNRFSAKAKEEMMATQMAGSKTKKGKKEEKEPKDFDACYRDCMYQATDGWRGIPAASFRCAMVSACKLCNFVMTHAKLSVFVEADGFDEAESIPLVRIVKGEPEKVVMAVRLPNGKADLRARAMWRPGWEALVRVQFDADQFTLEDVANLMMRVGIQVGIGEGRPDSRKSCGLGWGLFKLSESKEIKHETG